MIFYCKYIIDDKIIDETMKNTLFNKYVGQITMDDKK